MYEILQYIQRVLNEPLTDQTFELNLLVSKSNMN